MVDSEGRIVLVNREVERLFGYPREEMLGRPVEMLIPEHARDRHPAHRQAFIDQPSVRMMGQGRDLHGRRKDGTQVPIEIGLTPLVTDEGMFVLSSIVDLTARRRAEERFRAAVESAPSGMIMVDTQGTIVLVNREVERLFGYTRQELLGTSMDRLVPERFRGRHPQFRAAYFHAPGTRPMGAGRELFGLHKDGREIPIEIGLNPIETEEGLFVLSSVVDISARLAAEQDHRRLEEQLRQAQKMEAVGTLAGGIAHDFNNILGGILGYADLAMTQATDPAQLADLREVANAAARGRDLVASILRFSRQQESQRVPTDLTRVIADSIRLLRPTLPATIEITQDLDTVARALADPTAVQQVVMNLATNAAQAMPGGGHLSIALEQFYARDSYVRRHPELHEGPYILLRVTDNGPGMDEQVRSRAFEPFFTTKPPGMGSGLGLASAHGIMRQHEGSIEIESDVGRGTTVRCLFPSIEEVPLPVPTATTEPVHGGDERIVYLDDEPSLSRLGDRHLGSLGYRVTALTRAEDALVTLARGDVDLLVTDYTMPGMTGVELARRARTAGYTGPILLLSGMATELDQEACKEVGIGKVLGKPVGMLEMAAAVREALDRAKSGRQK